MDRGRPGGAIALPGPDEMRKRVAEQLAFMDVATDKHHSRGGKIIPFSMHNADEVLTPPPPHRAG